ncbi:hypothetical protein [Caproiciproducens sp.]
MPDYKKMYFYLFNQVTNSIQQLKEAQQEAERIYINSDDISPLVSLENKEKTFHNKKKPT